MIEQSNALGVKTGYSYDINGNLIQITRAARTTGTVGANHITSGGVQTSLIDTFTYDELGNRLSATNALKNTTTTDYDALGRVVQSKTAEGVTTKVDYVYDASISNLNSSKGGIRRTETDGLGKTLVDEQDYFGRTIKHTDKGEHVFTYTYNAGGWLTKQINSQGQSIDYSYYSNGSIKEIRDTALNLLTSYRYDNNGNRIEERYQELNGKVGEPRVFQNALINYDSLNRKISVQDQSFNIHYEYDGNGNIVHMLANYRDAVNAAPKIQDFWYSYDSMNRFTVSMGVLNSTTKKVERGNTGIAISYDKLGQRLTADYGKDALNSTKAHKESYSYTTDGYLETVKNADYSSTGILGTQYTVSTRYNDALGRVTKYTDNNENSTTVYQTTTTIYSKDNQITEQKKEGGTGAGTTKYTYLADKVTLDKTVMTPTSGSIQTTQYAYEWWDSAKQSKITTTVDGLKGETSLSYNINGHLSGFVDDKNAQNKRSATYINNSQGMVLQRNELINNTMNRYRNFYYVNGQRVGDLSNDGPSREDYVQNLQNNRATATQAKDFKPISSADFDQNFEPINAQYPSSASTSYVVNNGDTLQSIALSVWGDASMWYMLADVNGLSATDKLTAGQVLTVPNKVTNIHNNSETFRPYNPGEAIGNTQPTVPSPPPPPKPKKKCGGIAQIVMIVVAVVATIFTAGAALSVLAPGMSLFAGGLSVLAGTSSLGIAGSMAVAAGAAAVGSAASQLAGKAMGVVDSFSWSQVGISALTAAATAGVGGALAPAAGTAGTTATQSSWASAAKTAVNNGGWVAKGAVYGAVNYGSTYLANQVFGNNQSFSWASLGSSIVGSIAAAGIGAKGLLDGLGTTVSPYAYSLAGANAAAVIDDKWFGGAKPDYLNVSMAAIANTVGRQFGENADGWFADSNTNDLVANFNEEEFLRQEAIRSKTRPLYVADNSRNKDVLSDYHPNQLPTISIRASQEGELMAGVIGDNLYIEDNSIKGELYTIKVEAEIPDTTTNTLDGARSFFQNRAQALEEWGNASVPFQYSWATPKINTGNPRLDRYYFQPVNDLFNTTANIGWNALKLAGNTAAIVSNSPVALFSAVSGDYEASQQFYEDLYLSNPLTASIGGVRSGLGYIRDVREFNKANVVGRTIGTSQRGSTSLGLLNDIPVGSTTGEVLTASMPVSKSPGAALRDKWGYLDKKERQILIESKVEANAERWVRNYEIKLNEQYPSLNAHFVDKHGPDIPLQPNLEQRSIDGRHPRTGTRSRRGQAEISSQFNDWRTQMAVINEATTRVDRGLPRYTGVDRYNNPVVSGRSSTGVGRGYMPNRQNPSQPIFNPELNGWLMRFERTKNIPFTGYPTK
ncbi:LysM peptidoglycan-binding domain-containing protein [Acinetobacter pittii]